MTSVKDIHIETSATPQALGRARFVFTDDYSVFDWGKMPDTIPQKGASLCTMGAFNFELLERRGLPTHYAGIVDNGVERSLDEATEPPREMVIELTQVPDLPFRRGEYDYEAFHAAAKGNYLIPLEIVYRNTVPVGSSLRTRSTPADHGLGFDEWPAEPVSLADPIVEFSTKFEEQDRYLTREEAAMIAGQADLGALEDIAREVNTVITDRAAARDLEHHDGKIECFYYNDTIQLADVVGTFDENRFAYEGQQLSKEVLRQYYKAQHPAWVDAVSNAKTDAKSQGIADWRALCSVHPPALPDHVIAVASDLYAAGANAYTGRDWFDAPALAAAVDAVRALGA